VFVDNVLAAGLTGSVTTPRGCNWNFIVLLESAQNTTTTIRS